MPRFRDRPTSEKLFVVVTRIGALAAVFVVTHAALSYVTLPPFGQTSPAVIVTPQPSPIRPSPTPPSGSASMERSSSNTGKRSSSDHIKAERKSLIKGSATIATRDNATSRDTFTVDLWVCAATSCMVKNAPMMVLPSRAPKVEPSSGAEQRRSLGVVKVGGHIRAALRGYADVDTAMKSDEIQPVATKGDVAHWQWSLKVKKPGDYTLLLTMAVLEGDTRTSLVSRDISVGIRVDDTPTEWISRTAGKVVGSASAATTAAAALITAFVGYLGYRHGKKTGSTVQVSPTAVLSRAAGYPLEGYSPRARASIPADPWGSVELWQDARWRDMPTRPDDDPPSRYSG